MAKQQEARKFSMSSVKKSKALFQYVTKYRWYFFFGMIFLFLSSITFMAFPKILSKMIDVAFGNTAGYFSERKNIISALIILAISQGIFSFMRIYFFAQVSERALADIRSDLYSKIIQLDIPFFESRRVGEFISRMSSDIANLQDVFSFSLAELFRQFATLVVGIILILLISPRLTGIMLVTFPVMIVMAFGIGGFIRKLSRKKQDALADSNVIVEETFQNVKMVKAFTNESYEATRYNNSVERVVQLALKAASYRGAFISFIIVAFFASLIIVLNEGSKMLESGVLTTGQLTEFILYTAFIGGAFGGMGDLIGKLIGVLGSSDRVIDLLHKESETAGDAPTKVSLKGSLTFNQVHFAYPSRQDLIVLKNIDFKVEPGETIALVGASGAGKSTILQLILSFQYADQGSIFLDDYNIKDLHIKNVRDNMALVPQEVILFGGSIKENIAYGKLNATDEEIWDAAERANALDFIKRFPEGIETIVGDRGVQLSGGQRQRIAIARAILKDPVYLLLDEATSSLDAESEYLVQEALNKLMTNRTTIVIAHRLSTIRNVDRILVMNHGKIVESGSHEELSTRTDGFYQNLLRLQFQED